MHAKRVIKVLQGTERYPRAISLARRTMAAAEEGLLGRRRAGSRSRARDGASFCLTPAHRPLIAFAGLHGPGFPFAGVGCVGGSDRTGPAQDCLDLTRLRWH